MWSINIEDLKNCELTFPFDDVTCVYKVEGKMFALTDIQNSYISLKNDPEKNYMLRSSFAAIKPGYHLNKEHWITIDLGKDVPTELIDILIVESYLCVIQKLPKRVRYLYPDDISEIL